MVRSLLAVKGLLMYITAPDSKPSASASPPPLAVRKITGTSLRRGSSLILRQTVKPSISGIITSSRTRSKTCSPSSFSASAPPPAAVTSKPFCSRIVRSRLKMFSSSSTTRILLAIRTSAGGLAQPGDSSKPASPCQPMACAATVRRTAIVSRRRDLEAAADVGSAARFVHSRPEGLHQELVLGMVVAERRPDRVIHAVLPVHRPGRPVAVRVEGASHEQAVAGAALGIAFRPGRAEAAPVRVADAL